MAVYTCFSALVSFFKKNVSPNGIPSEFSIMYKLFSLEKTQVYCVLRSNYNVKSFNATNVSRVKSADVKITTLSKGQPFFRRIASSDEQYYGS